jgi:superfamily I DNA/RNA helicase
VQVVAQYGRALPALVADLRRRAVAHPGMAERVLATAHKAKGLEWPRVRLGADFPGLGELHAADRDGVAYLTPEERDQELHLLYVAATRARRQLEPNDAVRSCLGVRAGRVAPQREDGAMPGRR